jgi:hypothetical protein
MRSKLFGIGSNIPKIILTTLKICFALAAGYYVVIFLYIRIARMNFLLTFDGVEDAVLVQANRVLLDQKW